MSGETGSTMKLAETSEEVVEEVEDELVDGSEDDVVGKEVEEEEEDDVLDEVVGSDDDVEVDEVLDDVVGRDEVVDAELEDDVDDDDVAALGVATARRWRASLSEVCGAPQSIELYFEGTDANHSFGKESTPHACTIIPATPRAHSLHCTLRFVRW